MATPVAGMPDFHKVAGLTVNFVFDIAKKSS